MAGNSELDRTEAILNQQSNDVPIVIDENGQIHPATDGSRGLAIHDAKGDYGDSGSADDD